MPLLIFLLVEPISNPDSADDFYPLLQPFFARRSWWGGVGMTLIAPPVNASTDVEMAILIAMSTSALGKRCGLIQNAVDGLSDAVYLRAKDITVE